MYKISEEKVFCLFSSTISITNLMFFTLWEMKMDITQPNL